MTFSAVGMMLPHTNAGGVRQHGRKDSGAKGRGLSRFDWIKQLGDGTFGAVHLYRTKDTHELVAIKM